MQRQPSDSSSGSASKTIRLIGSRIARLGSKKDRDRDRDRETPSPTSIKPSVQKFLQELDATETPAQTQTDSAAERATGVLPHAIFRGSVDPTYQQLRDNIRCLKGASLGVNGVDSTFLSYSRCREQSLELCKALVQKAKSSTSSPSFDASRVSHPDSEPFSSPMNDAWLKALEDFKAYQEELLENLRESLVSTYQRYMPEATAAEQAMLLSDKTFRSIATNQMETTSMRSDTPEYWTQYNVRFKSFDLLKHDLAQIKTLCAAARSGKGADITVTEYDIATNGDTILEFSNSASQEYPVLRFRVLSYMLVEVSPLFAKILSSSYPEIGGPLEMPEDLPPAPHKQVWRDGIEVKVYRMPQLEFNTCGALTTLLHAAHMHTDKIPRQISFYEFVCIAEVCYRYQCTSPLEMAVEYRWLPQWVHKAHDDFDGFVLISYVFGLRGLFMRTSKSAILNITTSEEHTRDLWPPEVKNRIFAVREAKIAQIHAACYHAVQEFLCPPLKEIDIDGAVELTSTPRCPRRLHQCDATNLGWLMLIYNEIGILPTVMNLSNDFQDIPPVRQSINQLLNSLRRMPSIPQMHSGFCDHAPTFRKTMEDIYNSINGLTFREVCGRDGWALSKRYYSYSETNGGGQQEVFELPATILQESTNPSRRIDEATVLRIFLQIVDLRDLQAIAMVDKTFYSIYKMHELTLMKNVIRASRKHSTGHIHQQSGDSSTPRLRQPNTPTTARPRSVEYLPPIQDSDSGDETATTTTTPLSSPPSPSLDRSPFSTGDGAVPPQRLRRSDTSGSRNASLNGNANGHSSVNIWPDLPASLARDQLSNYKFLVGDQAHEKSLAVGGTKHLQEEQDQSLRNGFHSSGFSPP